MLHVLEQKCKVEKVGEGMLKMWFNAIFFFPERTSKHCCVPTLLHMKALGKQIKGNISCGDYNF